MFRKRDINLSHCGNASSRMVAPFCWLCEATPNAAKRRVRAQDVYCRRIRFFRRQSGTKEKAKVRMRSAEMRAAARMGGGMKGYISWFNSERMRSELINAQSYFFSARAILNGHNFTFSSSRLNSSPNIRTFASCHVASNFRNALFFIVSGTTGMSVSFRL